MSVQLGRSRAALALALALLCLAPGAVRAATPLSAVRVSPDTTVVLAATTVEDHGLVEDQLSGTVIPVALGSLPANADLDAYALLPGGDALLSFDVTVTLPGGITARRADVVRFAGGAYSILLDGAFIGLPRGIDIDAVAGSSTALLLSFDGSLVFGGVRIDDEDLVRYEGGLMTIAFDGSAAGIAAGLDLDAAERLDCNGHLLLSFDGSGTIAGVEFDDEDVLEYDLAGGWELVYDGSVHHPGWRVGDLDALHATVDPGSGPAEVFGQTVRAQPDDQTFAWPLPDDFDAVRGSFTSSTSVGAYTVTASWSGTGTSIFDSTVPPPAGGLWYLVKPRSCELTSWQSTLGAEPGRDLTLP